MTISEEQVQGVMLKIEAAKSVLENAQELLAEWLSDEADGDEKAKNCEHPPAMRIDAAWPEGLGFLCRQCGARVILKREVRRNGDLHAD